VRDWLTPRCILIVLLLVAAPGAALAHLLVTWAPIQLENIRLDRSVTRYTKRLDAEIKHSTELQQRTAHLQELAQATTRGSDWLPARDRHGVFDRIAEVLRDQHVTIEQFSLGEPALYAAVSGDNLLACEQVSALCTGDYAALTECVDRIEALDLPVRVSKLSWRRTGERLALALQLEVPFVPDQALCAALADKAGLPKENHEP
jgi:hypothetical protein